MTYERVMALIWTAATLGLHSVPRHQLETIPGAGDLVRASGPDKVVHVALFGVLGLLWSACLPRRPVIVLFAGIAYGVALELYQGWLIPGRSGSPEDVMADVVGMVLGLVSFAMFRRRRR